MVFEAQIPVLSGICAASKHGIELNRALFVVNEGFKSKS